MFLFSEVCLMQGRIVFYAVFDRQTQESVHVKMNNMCVTERREHQTCLIAVCSHEDYIDPFERHDMFLLLSSNTFSEEASLNILMYTDIMETVVATLLV